MQQTLDRTPKKDKYAITLYDGWVRHGPWMMGWNGLTNLDGSHELWVSARDLLTHIPLTKWLSRPDSKNDIKNSIIRPILLW